MANKEFSILLADDDEDDCFLFVEALQEIQIATKLTTVRNGEQLLYLLESMEEELPHVLFLDLNMPRKDGRTVLKEIKSDPVLRQIPVVVLTTSKADEDVYRSYDLGVNSYIVKPVTFEALVDILQTLEKYWFEIVELPPIKEA